MADIILSCSQRLPVDHRQRVVQKMRIDLRLQRLHLLTLLPDLALIHLTDQRVDLIQHTVETSHQNTDLIPGIILQTDRTMLRIDGIHTSCQRLNTAHQNTAHIPADQKDRQQAEADNQKNPSQHDRKLLIDRLFFHIDTDGNRQTTDILRQDHILVRQLIIGHILGKIGILKQDLIVFIHHHDACTLFFKVLQRIGKALQITVYAKIRFRLVKAGKTANRQQLFMTVIRPYPQRTLRRLQRREPRFARNLIQRSQRCIMGDLDIV